MQTDRCEYVEKTLADYEFAEDLTEKLKKLLVHDFAAKSQGEAFKEAKSDLKLGEVLVVGDFAENNKFLIQRVTQGNH